MKLAARKSKVGSFLNLYSYELDGIFLPTIISSVLLILFKEILLFFSAYEYRWTYTSKNITFKMLIKNTELTGGKQLVYSLNSCIVNALRLSLAIAVLMLALMSFYIWFKEWFGRKKTIFTLMTLPVSRFKIILSKLAAVITYGIIILGLPLLFIFIEINFLNIITGSKTFSLTNLINHIISTRLLFNNSVLVTILLLLIAGISLAFLVVMLNRSYIVKGTIASVIICGLILLLMGIGLYYSNNFLEYTWLPLINLFSLILTIVSLGFSNYLFKNKVHV